MSRKTQGREPQKSRPLLLLALTMVGLVCIRQAFLYRTPEQQTVTSESVSLPSPPLSESTSDNTSAPPDEVESAVDSDSIQIDLTTAQDLTGLCHC